MSAILSTLKSAMAKNKKSERCGDSHSEGLSLIRCVCVTQTYNDGPVGIETAQVVERQTLDRKVVNSNLGRSGGKILFCRVNFVC